MFLQIMIIINQSDYIIMILKQSIFPQFSTKLRPQRRQRSFTQRLHQNLSESKLPAGLMFEVFESKWFLKEAS